MTKMDAFRRAFAKIGDVAPETLSAYIKRTYHVAIDPKVIPVFLASMRDLDALTRLRAQARAAAQPSPN